MGFFIFLAAFTLLTLAFSLYCFKICFHSKGESGSIHDFLPEGEQYEPVVDRMVASAQRMAQAPCEHITIPGHKGTKLHGRFYEHTPGAPIMLIFHGYRGITFRDCAGGFALAQKIGFNVLAVDQRSHGESCGHVITFGVLERYDCLHWAEYAANRFPDTPLILTGVSMGAATVLMASDLPLPKNVVCIMADCPYSSPMGIISKVAVDMGYPKRLSIPLIWVGGFLFGGFNVCASSALSSVEKAKIPILLIHGEDDHFVPCKMSKQIKESCGENAQLHTFPSAGHGLCYLVDPRRYEQICIEFLDHIPSLQTHLSNSEYVRTNFTA